MSKMEISAMVAGGIALAAAGYLFVTGQEQTLRVQELEREVAALRSEARQPIHGGAVGGSPAEAERETIEPAATEGVAESDLADQVAKLAVTVEKLGQTAEVLDSRITRSRLAVPDETERKAQIQRARARLDELRKTADESRAKARQIAASLNVPFDEKRLLEPGATPALEEKPEFVAARDAAAAQMRVVSLFERKLADLQFSTVIEALPAKEAR